MVVVAVGQHDGGKDGWQDIYEGEARDDDGSPEEDEIARGFLDVAGNANKKIWGSDLCFEERA